MPKKRRLNSCEYQRLLLNRQLDEREAGKVQSSWQVTNDFIKRLKLEKELEGHEGCVNCLEWNETGTVLASASDDVHFILWDPFRYRKIHAYETGHRGNIFSVKFLPNTKDNTVVTGAGDCRVRVHDVIAAETTLICSCHVGRVKRLATAPHLPYMFWSAAEDGFIMEFDLRTTHACEKQKNNVLVNLRSYLGQSAEAKCLAINPSRPELLAVGANDSFIRLYDRRMIRPVGIQCPNDTRPGNNFVWNPLLFSNVPDGCVEYFVSGHIPLMDVKSRLRKSISCTYLTFSPSGTELLANMGNEQIYLFDISNKRQFKKYSSASMEASGERGESDELGNNYDSEELIQPPPESHVRDKYKNGEQFAKTVSSYADIINKINIAILSRPKSPTLYQSRALALLQREWDGDVYAAYRDLCTAIQLNPSFFNAHFLLAHCLLKLRLFDQASQCLSDFKARFPDKVNNKTFRSLSGLVEESISAPSPGRSTSASATDDSNTSEHELNWRADAVDYEQRYLGHCNRTTDIKEANFFGRDGQYIVAGSDDGSFYVWDRYTTNIVGIFRGDDSIVNCLQPHPSACLLATSGIEPVVKLWSPVSSGSQTVNRTVTNFYAAALANQRRMTTDPFESMLINLGFMPEFSGENDELFNSSWSCGTS